MFILYAVVIGLALGLAARGRASRLADLELRWPWAIVIGILVQVVLFNDAVEARVGDLGPVLYVASTGLVLAAIARNARIPGMAIVLAGAVCNFAAILANGGYMPAGRGALEAIGHALPTAYSNSALLARPSLEPLADVFALPRWLPFTNIFSIGDVLIGVGIAAVIFLAMVRGETHPAATA